MRSSLALVLGSAAVVTILLSETKAQEGTVERIGKQIDRGLEQLGQELEETWAEVRRSVDKLGVQGRIYGRLRWDKALADLPIEVQVQNKDTAVLTGRVPDETTRLKAAQLTEDTVGVREVINRLQVDTR